ncbi:MAG: tripartite tricarboxylate transporter permease [Gammaproteobacteria bacterium]|jgi:putative tricarboxylic transport membrane protein
MGIETLNYLLNIFLNPDLIFLIFMGTLVGVLVGALPGLSSSMAIALLLPFTLYLEPIESIALMSALYCAGTFGGSITAILINAPGAPPAAATAFDGYPLAQRGEAGKALGISAISSATGGIISVFALLFFAPLLARVAYSFGPPEYFALALFGISMLASIGSESPVKNIIGGLIGLLLATVGIDLMTGVERFTFGNPELYDGIDFIPVLIGLFAISELINQSLKINQDRLALAVNAVKLPTLKNLKKIKNTILRSSLIGTFIGVLPAEGSTMAAMIGYNEAKRWSAEPEKFGTGEIEGIAGPEAANNAATGGAMVPTLALGIPGSATAAIILGGLQVQGLRPGPYLFEQQPDLLYGIFASMLIANILFIGIGLYGAKYLSRVSLIPIKILWPIVLCLCIVGAYGLEQSMIDVWIMLIAGIVGYLLKNLGITPAPIIMGLVLGTLIETSLAQSLILFEGSWLGFFSRPIALLFISLSLVSLFGKSLYVTIKKYHEKD